jgi:STE24 endopeptidase
VNAFVAGQGPSRRIVLWDTFVAQMSPDEVANAVAHELGHLNDRSSLRLVLASLLLVPYLFVVAVVLRWLGRRKRFGFDGDTDVASLPAAMLLSWAIAFAGNPLSAAYERHLERRADQYALELLRQPEAFRSMMVKLGTLNRADLHPPGWVVVLLTSHPRVIDRIEHAERFAREQGIAMSPASPAAFQVAVPASSAAAPAARAAGPDSAPPP